MATETEPDFWEPTGYPNVEIVEGGVRKTTRSKKSPSGKIILSWYGFSLRFKVEDRTYNGPISEVIAAGQSLGAFNPSLTRFVLLDKERKRIAQSDTNVLETVMYTNNLSPKDIADILQSTNDALELSDQPYWLRGLYGLTVPLALWKGIPVLNQDGTQATTKEGDVWYIKGKFSKSEWPIKK